MNEFDVLDAAGSGMEAQRAALDVAARNVAAAEVDGTSFARLVPRFALGAPDSDEPVDRAFPNGAGDDEPSGVAASDVEANDREVRFLGTRSEPGIEPDAIAEMVAVLDAQRAYEANASVFDAGKRLMERTIDVERL